MKPNCWKIRESVKYPQRVPRFKRFEKIFENSRWKILAIWQAEGNFARQFEIGGDAGDRDRGKRGVATKKKKKANKKIDRDSFVCKCFLVAVGLHRRSRTFVGQNALAP